MSFYINIIIQEQKFSCQATQPFVYKFGKEVFNTKQVQMQCKHI